MVLMRLIQSRVGKLWFSGAIPVKRTIVEKIRISAAESIPSQIMRPAGPRDIIVSNAYLNLSLRENLLLMRLSPV
jgi:hypothetical protein